MDEQRAGRIVVRDVDAGIEDLLLDTGGTLLGAPDAAAEPPPPLRPLYNPFPAGERIPWCLTDMGDFWAVRPETRWETTRAIETTAWFGPQHSDMVKPTLEAGTALALVAIHPCDDTTNMCSYWQGFQSAHAFRVEGGPFAGYVVEVWGWEQEPAPGTRLLDQGTLISFGERIAFHMPQTQARPDDPVGRDADRP